MKKKSPVTKSYIPIIMKKGFLFPKPVPSVISIVKKEPCDINHNAVVKSEPVDFDFRPLHSAAFSTISV